MNISVEEFIKSYSSILGVGGDSSCAYDLINKARLVAYPLGDWIGTMDYMGFNASKGVLTLPSEVDFIRGARGSCGIIEIDAGHVTKEIYCGCRANPIISKKIGRVYSPFQSTENIPYFAYAVNKNDIGKQLRVQYENSKGTRHDEYVDLLHLQPTVLLGRPARILRVTKPVTAGAVAFSIGVDPENPIEITYLAANDMHPTYSQYCFSFSGCLALEVKKRMLPYSIESIDEILDIHPEALSILIAAVIAKDTRKEGWQKDYSASISLAVNFLRQEQINEDSTNDAQLSVQFHDYTFEELTTLQSI